MIYLPHPRVGRVNWIGFWPYPETTPENKDMIAAEFKALTFTYGVGVNLIDTPDQAMFNKGPIVVIEEWTNNPAQIDLKNFEHPDECLYITGNNQCRWPSAKWDADHRVYFRTAALSPLYGSQAAAIVLQDRYTKNASI